MSGGRYDVFMERPIAATLLAVGAALVLLNLWSFARRGLDWRAWLALEERGERRALLPAAKLDRR